MRDVAKFLRSRKWRKIMEDRKRIERLHKRNLNLIKTTIMEDDLVLFTSLFYPGGEDDDEEVEGYFTPPQEKRAHLSNKMCEAECGICHGTYQAGDTVCFSHNEKCENHFHEHCIRKWLLLSMLDKCPICTNPFHM